MGSVRALLSVMMFLQYFVWGAWAVELGTYMGKVLEFSGSQVGWVYSSTAIAAMISPLFLGYVADRLMSTEKVLALLHLIGAGLLTAAAILPTSEAANSVRGANSVDSSFYVLFAIMVAYSLCYMPTLALTNSISFDNILDPEKDFPIIRVFGTFGWIVAGLVVGFLLKAAPDSVIGEALYSVVPASHPLFVANNFILLAAIASAVLGLYCFLLPHTPPKQKNQDAAANVEQNRSRAGILSLLSEPSFLVFVLASFLICIPLAFYYNLANLFLSETKAPYPTALQALGQGSEVLFMALMPWFIMKLGVKKMLAIGMLAWVLRYLAFGTLYFPLVVFGIVLHGICYDFFFVASQIYIDTKVDVSQRARAQSFIAFVTLGVGMFVGALVAGQTYDAYAPEIKDGVADWFYIWLWPAIAAGATLAFFWIGFRDRAVGRDRDTSRPAR